jgi:ABC-type lipoprotein release transport system permease subunit
MSLAQVDGRTPPLGVRITACTRSRSGLYPALRAARLTPTDALRTG